MLHAQQQPGIKGVLYKNNSAARIALAVITNPRTNTIMLSDELGMFTIPASPGDTLLITKKGYTAYRHAVSNKNDIIIYLQPEMVIELDEVKVKGITKREEFMDIMSSYRSQGSLFLGKPPALLFLNSPITGLYELFGKTPKRARHFATFAKADLEQDIVNRRYNKDLVKRVTSLNDEQAQKFMDYYTPSFEDMQGWNDYELVKRVKRYFEYYKKNPTP